MAMRVWQRQCIKDAKRFEAVRAHIRRSINAPQPSLPADEAEVELARFMKGETKGLPNASHQGRIPAESYCKSEKHLLHAALASPNHRVASGHVDRITA